MEHLKEVSQKPYMRPFGADSQGFFKYLLLNCTINRDVCKRTYMLGAFIQHLIYIWLDFLRLLLDLGVQNCTPGYYF